MKKKSEQVAMFKQLGQYRMNKAAEGMSFESYVPSFYQSSKQMDYEDPIFDWNIKQIYHNLNCQAVALNPVRIKLVARLMKNVISKKIRRKAQEDIKVVIDKRRLIPDKVFEIIRPKI